MGSLDGQDTGGRSFSTIYLDSRVDRGKNWNSIEIITDVVRGLMESRCVHAGLVHRISGFRCKIFQHFWKRLKNELRDVIRGRYRWTSGKWAERLKSFAWLTLNNEWCIVLSLSRCKRIHCSVVLFGNWKCYYQIYSAMLNSKSKGNHKYYTEKCLKANISSGRSVHRTDPLAMFINVNRDNLESWFYGMKKFRFIFSSYFFIYKIAIFLVTMSVIRYFV